MSRYSYHASYGVTRKKTLGDSIKTFFAATATSLGIVGLVAAPAFAAKPNTVVVTDATPNGWVKVAQESGGTINFVASSSAPLGTGAAEFYTPTGDSYTRLRKPENLKLSSINKLSYKTFQVSPPTISSIAAVNLRLYIDLNGDNTFDDVLVYEPYYNGTVDHTWQTWDGITGYWWSNGNGSTDPIVYNGHVNPGAGGGDGNIHLTDVLHDYPNANVVSIGLGTGTSNSPWTVQADALSVNNTTYDFENTQTKKTATNKDDCKDTGWTNVYQSNGASFKNQGECVSYVASNGKSAH